MFPRHWLAADAQHPLCDVRSGIDPLPATEATTGRRAAIYDHRWLGGMGPVIMPWPRQCYSPSRVSFKVYYEGVHRFVVLQQHIRGCQTVWRGENLPWTPSTVAVECMRSYLQAHVAAPFQAATRAKKD
jgi:hypothetical protein